MEDVGSLLACRKKTSIFRFSQASKGKRKVREKRKIRLAPTRVYRPLSPLCTCLYPPEKGEKKLPTYPSLTGTAVEERLNCLTIIYFHFPHLTSSSAILIFSMCTRRWFDILPRIWSPIIPESRSPISSCHFTSKEGQDRWCIHFHHTARLKFWKSFFQYYIANV